jgi:hypothetical protein
MNQDNDSDIFDPFLALVKSSKHFDQEDVACLEETRKEHQKHVETRIQMDLALKETKTFLLGRLRQLQEFETTVSLKTRASPAYKHFFETFTQKQVQIHAKYKDLRERREAIYGPYTTPPPSPHQAHQAHQALSGFSGLSGPAIDTPHTPSLSSLSGERSKGSGDSGESGESGEEELDVNMPSGNVDV